MLYLPQRFGTICGRRWLSLLALPALLRDKQCKAAFLRRFGLGNNAYVSLSVPQTWFKKILSNRQRIMNEQCAQSSNNTNHAYTEPSGRSEFMTLSGSNVETQRASTVHPEVRIQTTVT